MLIGTLSFLDVSLGLAYQHSAHVFQACIDLLFKIATFSSDAARYIGYELRRLAF